MDMENGVYMENGELGDCQELCYHCAERQRLVNLSTCKQTLQDWLSANVKFRFRRRGLYRHVTYLGVSLIRRREAKEMVENTNKSHGTLSDVMVTAPACSLPARNLGYVRLLSYTNKKL